MIDPLFERSRLAIAENRLLMQRHKVLREELEIRRGRLRLTLRKDAMDHPEREVVLEDKQ